MSKTPNEDFGPSRLTFLKNTFNYVKDSAPVKIITGSAVGRVIGVITVLASATVATVPATIVGLSAIAVGATIDTIDTRTLRLLRKENSLLTKNRNARERQDELLKNEPILSRILEDKLYIPSRTNQTSLTKRYIDTTPNSSINVSSYGKALLKNSIDVVKNVSSALFAPSLIGAGKVGKAALGLYGESKKQATKEEIGLRFKQNIDQERNKPDAPGYDDLIELAQATREQRVQTLAIQKMVNEGSFRGTSAEKVLAAFETAKQEVLKTEKVIQDTRGVVGTVKSYSKDFIRAHDPLSKYNNLDQLKTSLPESSNDKTPKSPSAKALQKDKSQAQVSAISAAKVIKKKLVQPKIKLSRKNKRKRSKPKNRQR